MKVGVITPVKNEEENLPSLIESVKNQSLKPFAWVIVNDNSTDDSRKIIDEKTKLEDWIYLIDKKGSKEYKMEENYAEVLSVGYELLDEKYSNSFDYYMVLDGDMKLSKDYIKEIVGFMEENKTVVIASGGIYYEENKDTKLEKRFSNEPAGGATLYDGEFFRSIDGPYVEVCPDTCAKIKARSMGYECRYLSNFDVKAIQSRKTGGKRDSMGDAITSGKHSYKLGKSLIVTTMKSLNYCISKSTQYCFGFLIGYFKAIIKNEDQVKDEEILEYNKSLFEILRRKIRKNK